MCLIADTTEDTQTGTPHRDLVVSSGAGMAAFAAGEGAGAVGLGVRGLGTQIAVSASVSALTFAQRLVGRRRRRRAALVTRPRSAWRISARALGFPPSALAEPWSEDGIAPYVPRDGDDELARLIRRESFVLLVGGRDTGRRRSALVAVKVACGDLTLLVAAKPGAADGPDPLVELMALDAACWGAGPFVLLIPGLERHLEHGKIDCQALQRWLARDPRRRIVATIDAAAFELYANGAEPALRTGSDVVGAAVDYSVPAFWSVAEMARATVALPGVDDTLPSLSLHLGRGDRQLRRWWNAEQASPEGAAVVRATIACQRANGCRPVAIEDIRARFPSHLVEMPLDGDLGELFQCGLTWATDPAGGAPLLTRSVSDRVVLTVAAAILADAE
jgi:hypothetical protein